MGNKGLVIYNYDSLLDYLELEPIAADHFRYISRKILKKDFDIFVPYYAYTKYRFELDKKGKNNIYDINLRVELLDDIIENHIGNKISDDRDIIFEIKEFLKDKDYNKIILVTSKSLNDKYEEMDINKFIEVFKYEYSFNEKNKNIDMSLQEEEVNEILDLLQDVRRIQDYLYIKYTDLVSDLDSIFLDKKKSLEELNNISYELKNLNKSLSENIINKYDNKVLDKIPRRFKKIQGFTKEDGSKDNLKAGEKTMHLWLKNRKLLKYVDKLKEEIENK